MRHVYCNNVIDWFVAESPEYAAKLWREYMHDTIGENDLEMYEDDGAADFEQEPDGKVLSIIFDDYEMKTHEKPCSQWADEHPIGFLGTTEY